MIKSRIREDHLYRSIEMSTYRGENLNVRHSGHDQVVSGIQPLSFEMEDLPPTPETGISHPVNPVDPVKKPFLAWTLTSVSLFYPLGTNVKIVTSAGARSLKGGPHVPVPRLV